jgi:hypothetical protein
VERLKELRNPAGKPAILHFDLWNNNMMYIAENEPFRTPAVFVEFGTIEWRHQGRGIRDAAVTAVLHVITQRNAPTSDELHYVDVSLEFFDLLTGINARLHGHTSSDGLFSHDALTAVRSATDHDFAELRHDTETFACHVMEKLK